MRTMITFLMLSALAGCELYAGSPDPADDAPPAAALDPVEQCYTLATALCESGTACGYSDAVDPCVEQIAADRCDVNQTVVEPGVLIALEVDLRGRACDDSPTWVQWIDGDRGAAVLGVMLRWR